MDKINQYNINVSLGELLDRYNILTIKHHKKNALDFIMDHNVNGKKFGADYEELNDKILDIMTKLPSDIQLKINDLFNKLNIVNLNIWNLESAIRHFNFHILGVSLDRTVDSDWLIRNSSNEDFVDYVNNVKTVRELNDKRSMIKKQINNFLDIEDITAEKYYD